MDTEKLIHDLRQLGKYSKLEPNWLLVAADKIEELSNRVEVKQGYWKDNYNGTFTCSVCGGKASKMKYCGNCGAEMNDVVAQCGNCKHWIYFADEKKCMCEIHLNYFTRDYYCGKWERKETK